MRLPCVMGSCALLNLKILVLNICLLLSGTRSKAITHASFLRQHEKNIFDEKKIRLQLE